MWIYWVTMLFWLSLAFYMGLGLKPTGLSLAYAICIGCFLVGCSLIYAGSGMPKRLCKICKEFYNRYGTRPSYCSICGKGERE